MPFYLENEFDPSRIPLILDKIAAAITVIDLEGRMLYYNEYSAQVLDRKPAYEVKSSLTHKPYLPYAPSPKRTFLSH